MGDARKEGPRAGGYDKGHDRYEAEYVVQEAIALSIRLQWTPNSQENQAEHEEIIRDLKSFLKEQIGKYGSVEEVDKSLEENFPGSLGLASLNIDWGFLSIE